MSEWLAMLTEDEEETHPQPDTRTQQDKTQAKGENRGLCPVMSGCRVEVSEKPAAGQSDLNSSPDTADVSPYGQSCGGSPLTWTGKVVSLADWRTLSEWERHGPDGRMWNGKLQQREDQS